MLDHVGCSGHVSAHLTQSVATGCRQSWQPVASCYRCDLRLTIDPKGLWVCCSWQSARPGQHVRASEQAQDRLSPEKIDVTSKSPVGDISAATLVRTDATLDHSQKAEKIWLLLRGGCAYICGCVRVVCFGGVWFGAVVARPSAGNTYTAVRGIVGPKPPYKLQE